MTSCQSKIERNNAGDDLEKYKIKGFPTILLIDDNCESLGAKWKNKILGNQLDMCAWSFDNGKTIQSITDKDDYFKAHG